jgi:hypothetical protein
VNAFDRLTDALVRRAARRWPAEVAESLLREWRAELAVLQTQPHTGTGHRIWRQVAFASSLAFSPSSVADGRISSGWRQLSQWGRAGQQFALMLGIALATMVVARAMNEIAFQVLTGNNWRALPPRSVQAIGTVAAQLLGIVIMTIVGAWLSRRSRPALETLRSGSILRAAYFVVPLGVAEYVVHVADAGIEDLYVLQGYPFQPQAAVAIGAWTIVMVFSVAASLRLAARGKRVMAWLAAAAGALFAADISGFVAAERAARSLQMGIASGPAWFLRSYLPDGSAGLGAQFPSGLTRSFTLAPPVDYRLHPLYVVVPLAGAIAVPLMLCGGFLVTYVLRRPAVSTAPVTAGPHEGSARTPARRWVRIFAGATATAGLAVWASISALPNYRSLDNFNASAIAYEERVTAILLVTLALMLMAPGRARIGAAAIATSMLLLVADGVVGRAEWSGFPVAIAMFGFGATVALIAFWLSRRFAAAGSDESVRRTPTIAAVIAAAAIPTDIGVSDILANHEWIALPGGGATGPMSPPALFAAVSVGLAVLLVVFALVAAWSGRAAPISLPALTTFVVVACALLLLGIVDASAVGRALFWPDVRFFVQPALIVVVLGVQRWRSGSGVRTIALWCLGGIGAAIASVAASQPMFYIGIVVTTPLLRAVYEGTMRPYDVFGSSNVWSHIVVGIALALLLARPARDAAPERTTALAASA